MTQVFAEDGSAVPCTVLQAGPCVVVQRRTKATDGYEAVQLGLVEFVKPQRVNKAMTGHFKKANVAPMRYTGEMRIEDSKDETKAGDRVLVDGFKIGEYVDVSGVSKGKGFQGGVKRWHYRGGDASARFDASPRARRHWRELVSFARLEGAAFSGTYGTRKQDVKNLRVVKIDADENLLLVCGAVPGPNGSYIYIRKAKTAQEVERDDKRRCQ